MKNLASLQEQLKLGLRPRDLIQESKPISSNGVVLREKWSNMFDNGLSFGYNTANAFLREAYTSNISDPEISGLYKKVHEYLNEKPLTSFLAIIAEGLNALSDNPLNSMFKEKVDGLLGLEESEMKSQIRNGILDHYRNYNGISMVIEKANADVKIVENQMTTTSTPITYFECNEGCTYVRVNDYVIALSESDINITNRPQVSEKFRYLSTLVGSSVCEDGSFVFETAFGKFSLTDDVISKIEGDKVTEVSTAEFMNNSKLLIESANHRADAKRKHFDTIDGIIALKEHSESVASMDKFHSVKTPHMNETVTLIEHAGSYAVLVSESKRHPLAFDKFVTVTEAIAKVTKLTGVDLTEKFAEQIAADNNVSAKKLANITAQKSIIEKIDERITSITDSIRLTENGSEAHIKLTEAYGIAKELLSEEQSKLSQLVK